MSERKNAVFRYIAYSLEIILCFVLLSTPNLIPEIAGAKPALLLCVALTVAVFEHEIPAMIFGAAAGILMDLGYSHSVGLFAISLTLICFLLGWIANNLVTANIWNFLLIAAVVIGGVYMLYYLIWFVWAGIEDSGVYFYGHILSRMIQTFLWSIGFYFLNRFIYHTLSEDAG